MAQLAALALSIHLGWILFVIFGALWTRGRRVWTAVHVLALLWGIAFELGPWPCPLTLAEQYFERRAGEASYQGSFLFHYLDAIVYPNLSDQILTWFGVAVCGLNLAIYGLRLTKAMKRGRAMR